MDKKLNPFRKKVAFKSALSDAFRRGYVYNENLAGYQKNRAKRKLVSLLEHKLPSIIMSLDSEAGYTEGNLCQQIENLANDVTAKLHADLSHGRFRMGTAQKLINVYWKFLWLFNLSNHEPLHCPVDSIILGQLPAPLKGYKWTQLDSIDEYRDIIEAIRAKAQAKNQSIALWELETYNEAV